MQKKTKKNNNIDTLCLLETKMVKGDDYLKFPGYAIERKDRGETKTEAVRNTIPYSRKDGEIRKTGDDLTKWLIY